MLRIGVLGRTTIDVDVSFLVLIGLFVFYDVEQSGWEQAILWAPILLISILVHELAHAGTIGAFGYGASRVVLLGTGGVTINQRHAKPWQEVVISLAGPISSFVLALIAFVSLPFTHEPILRTFCAVLVAANIFWGVLNLLPVAPLDGGHALRHFLRIFMTENAAFFAAVWVGMIVGAGVAIYATYTGNFWVAIVIAFYAFRNFQAWRAARSHHDDISDGMN
jgi:Zn-dependent protease